MACTGTAQKPFWQDWPSGQRVPSAAEHGRSLQSSSDLRHAKSSLAEAQLIQQVFGAVQSLGSSHAYLSWPLPGVLLGKHVNGSASFELLLVQTSVPALQRLFPQEMVFSVEPGAPVRGDPGGVGSTLDSTLGSALGATTTGLAFVALGNVAGAELAHELSSRAVKRCRGDMGAGGLLDRARYNR